MEIRSITRDEWIDSLTDLKEDKFAKVFLGKADARGYWDKALGCFVEGELAGGIISTHSKREPKTMNIQILHTFYDFRRRGVAKYLCEYAYQEAFKEECKYFRVSSAPKAKPFYESLGMEFWGRQKSGGYLCFHKMISDIISEGVYDREDSITLKKVYQDRGCIVK